MFSSSSCGRGLRVASFKFSCNPSHLQNFGFRLNVDGLQRPVLASSSDESLEELEQLKEHLNRSPVHSRARAVRVWHYLT